MRKIWNSIAKDLWIVLLDIIAVNAAYLLALLIRFYVNFQLRPVAVNDYLPAWARFTPFYTVAAIIVFVLFRLYGGMWRYAGINDMNRIIGASLVTALIHTAGTLLFVMRMPITYYVIGAILQFTFVVIIRFSYRAIMVEKKKIAGRRLPAVNTMVIGAGENGRRVVKNLEDTDSYRPVVIVGAGSGMLDGIPVLGIDQIESAVKQYQIRTIFVADPLLSTEDRRRIKEISQKEELELQDYTGYFSNLGGKIPLTELFAVLHSPVTIELDGREESYPSTEEALRSLTEKYEIKSIDAENLRIRLEKKKTLSPLEAIAREYMAEMGE